MDQVEEWLSLKIGKNSYSISDHGRVKNNQTNYILQPSMYGSGYLEVYLYDEDGGYFRSGVHQLVAKLFLGNREKPWQVNHKNGIKSNNMLENLEWVTPSQNSQHSYDLGLSKAGYPLLNGERHPSAKLNWEKVRQIREINRKALELPKRLRPTSAEIGSQFGISYRTVLKVISGEMWKEELEESRKDLDYVPSTFVADREMLVSFNI